MGSAPPSPRLTRTTALAQVQSLVSRVQALVPTLTTGLSPTTVYQPGCPVVSWGRGISGTGNILLGGPASTTFVTRPITIVQTAQQTFTTTTVGLAFTVPLTQTTTVGNCVLAIITTGSSAANNPTLPFQPIMLGSLQDNWGMLGLPTGTGSDAGYVYFWADPSCAGGQSSVTVQTTNGAGTMTVSITVLEVAGLAPTLAGLLDQSQGQSSTATLTTPFPWTSNATATTTQASEMWLGAVITNTQVTITGPTAFTNFPQQNGGTTFASMAGYEIVSAEAAAAYAGDFSATSHFDAAVVALKAAPLSLNNSLGVWTAPDVNGDGSNYIVQVECFGGGGGGGGGDGSTGGGGAGGGEYACESAYTITPGKPYIWVTGLGGGGGTALSSGAGMGVRGGDTVFDLLGIGLPDGVYAHGGSPGDSVAAGTPGAGGSGSVNTIHDSGGQGGGVASNVGSDNAIDITNDAAALFINGANDLGPPLLAWYMMCDNIPQGSGNTVLSDFSGGFNDATINYIAGNTFTYTKNAPIAPAQVPTFTGPGHGLQSTNPTIVNYDLNLSVSSLTTTTANVAVPSIGFAGQYTTISCWIQPPTTGGGDWSNTAVGSWGTIATNALGSAYTGSGNFTGFALGVIQRGTVSSPSWTVQFKVGNNSNSHIECAQGVLNHSGWNHVVATFANGAMVIWVNGVNVASGSASISSIPATGFNVSLFSSADSAHIGAYFGHMSGLWFASDALNSTGVAQAYGSAPATGGGGGGASGGSGGAGGVGASAAGASGGAAGTAASVPSSLAGTTTGGSAGTPGAAANSPNSFTTVLGGGGGGSGDTATTVTSGVNVFYFTSAVTYNGTDAQAGAASGQVFNPVQQGTSNVLFTGAGVNDLDSGAKNTMMLIDPGLNLLIGFYTTPGGSTYSIQNKVFQVSLTVFNANPSNPEPVVLELSYSYDTKLPSSYTGTSIIGSLGQVVIPPGASSVTVDLTTVNPAFYDTLIGTNYPNKAGALILGPGPLPTVEAYGTVTAPAFNAQIYGPGAVDSMGNSLAPYLTVQWVQNNANTPNLGFGANGGPGGIYLTYVSPEATPVAGIQPYQTTDGFGTTWAQGFTGQLTAFQPGTKIPETWHLLTPPAGWTVGTKFEYRLTGNGTVSVRGTLTVPASAPSNPVTVATMPVGYLPTQSEPINCIENSGSPYTGTAHVCTISTGGSLQIYGAIAGSSTIRIWGEYPVNS